MRTAYLIAVSTLALVAASPAWGQAADPSSEQGGATTAQGVEAPGQASAADVATQTSDGPSAGIGGDIVVTAQRQSQRLQDVPIAVSAFTAEGIERQQIRNPLDLQLTLPNVQFTKGNFTTSSSLTIRGIGDLCVGVTCDQATAIHLNDEPLFASPFFQTEFYDVERIEVLRGPQGTLFGRNATAGVVNIATAKPDLSSFGAAGEVEYGNYDSVRVRGMVNVPIADFAGIRLAGIYLKRDGFTRNVFDNSRVDDRDLFSVRGTLRIEPSADTTIDLIASYFREDDRRLRVSNQLCQRDPTGVLGCLPGRLDFSAANTNATFAPGTLPSREFFGVNGIPQAFGLGSLYGPDTTSNFSKPRNLREINSDFRPEFFSDELILQGKLRQTVGQFNVSLSGTYQDTNTDSRQDYLFSVSDRSIAQPGINTLAVAAGGLIPGLPAAYFAPIAAALIPNGPAGDVCTSLPETTGTGAFGGFRECSAIPSDFDRSVGFTRSYSAEAIVSSDLDGPFNFLLGAIYSNSRTRENSYYVNSFYIDYVSGLLGTFTALGNRNPPVTGVPAPLPPSFLATPYFRNNTDDYRLKSYGLFGEAYLELGDRLKLTGGIRYNNDRKAVRGRSTLASFLAPFGSTDAFASPFVGTFDADAGTPGAQPFQERRVKFSEFTGRFVADFQVTPNNLLYASYSRGYKSGGINPPLQPIFEVSDTFRPEFINAFEVGSKNTFDNGRLTLNLTGFYYQYNDLQLSRIVARTAVNDNVDAEVYGVEAEAILRPTRALTVNLGASYLKTKVTRDLLLANPRDPSGGRADAVIIKDISNGANCAVTSNVGSAAAAQAYVTAVNNVINATDLTTLRPRAAPLTTANGLRPPTAFPSNSGLAPGSTGAFSLCQVLQAQTANPAFAALGGITLNPSGVLVNIRGNELPQAPSVKFSAGVQYQADLGGGYSIVPRFDLAYTGEFQAAIFNLPIDRVEGYEVLNAQVQLNGPDERFYFRGFVQNITNNNAITGQYVTDASSALFTNVFILEPRRYGVAAGFRF
jgi:outer membrane receptor protein involved in Fe transport